MYYLEVGNKLHKLQNRWALNAKAQCYGCYIDICVMLAQSSRYFALIPLVKAWALAFWSEWLNMKSVWSSVIDSRRSGRRIGKGGSSSDDKIFCGTWFTHDCRYKDFGLWIILTGMYLLEKSNVLLWISWFHLSAKNLHDVRIIPAWYLYSLTLNTDTVQNFLK